jgi:predicted ArsR family transcriptional regulator
MLKELLALLASSQSSSVSELAERLGQSVELVESMLERLCAMGYLIDLSRVACSGGGCAGCSGRGACALMKRPAVWSLTPKGKALLAA